MECLRAEIPEIKVSVINPGYIKTNLSVNAVTGSGEVYGGINYFFFFNFKIFT